VGSISVGPAQEKNKKIQNKKVASMYNFNKSALDDVDRRPHTLEF